MTVDSTAIEGREDGGAWVASTVGAAGFRAELAARSHQALSDEPTSFGGTDAGPTPYEYLLMAISACTSMTVRMYATRKGWPLESAVVSVRQARSHEPDCARCETESVGMGNIERKIELSGPLTEEQRARLLDIAERCPIKQTLEKGVHVKPIAVVA
ncbi:MAG: OsmC family protein [Gemmatimonadaceae bacterium]